MKLFLACLAFLLISIRVPAQPVLTTNYVPIVTTNGPLVVAPPAPTSPTSTIITAVMTVIAALGSAFGALKRIEAANATGAATGQSTGIEKTLVFLGSLQTPLASAIAEQLKSTIQAATAAQGPGAVKVNADLADSHGDTGVAIKAAIAAKDAATTVGPLGTATATKLA